MNLKPAKYANMLVILSVVMHLDPCTNLKPISDMPLVINPNLHLYFTVFTLLRIIG